MMNNISEGTLRSVVKTDPASTIQAKEAVQQKAEALRQARPVETSEGGARSDEKKNQKESSSKYVLDENKLFFEKYDQRGEVVLRIPPAHKPVDERA